jgi:hypothetical protein
LNHLTIASTDCHPGGALGLELFQTPSGESILGGVIVIVNAALGLAEIFGAAHSIVHEQS